MSLSARRLLLVCLAHLGWRPLLATDAKGVSGGGYACEKEQNGFHILLWEDCSIVIWKHALASSQPLKIGFEKSINGRCAPTRSEVERQVEQRLRIGPRQTYQQPWRYFTPQGRLVHDKASWDAALLQGPIFLIEGGQFQWPPVSIGFRQKVEGLVNNGVQIELETLAVRPPIFRIYGLASEEESKELISYAKQFFRQADVVYMDHDKGKAVDEFRTSLNYRPEHNETPLVAQMEARAAALTRMPASHFEEPQILEYGQGGFYHAHDDAARLEFYAKDKNALTQHHYGYFDRMLTVFWYMNTVPKGGETNFPRAHGGDVPHTMQKCIQGLTVAPVAGMAVMWYNMEPRGLVDPYALHAACAVGEGEKHAINIWVYNKERLSPPAQWDPKHPRVSVIRGTNSQKVDDEDKVYTISLINEGASNVNVYWQGPESEQLVAELAPGESNKLNTFEGHRFIAKMTSGEEIGNHLVKKKPRRPKFKISDRAFTDEL